MCTENRGHSLTTWQLAKHAETTDPDAHDGIGFPNYESSQATPSAGAKFLRRVADTADEIADEIEAGTVDDLDDRIHEEADAAVPIYTHEMWTTFVDLAAYTEDVSEFASGDEEMDRLAAVALYIIAERLLQALVREWTTTDPD